MLKPGRKQRLFSSSSSSRPGTYLPGLLVSIIFSFPILLSGQELRFKQYTIDNGFSSVGTSQQDCITQDAEGFMWFTTFQGINRFDGRKFKIFQHEAGDPHSLGQNVTTSICAAVDGKVWVGTSDQGIYIFDPATEKFEAKLHHPENPDSPCGNDISFIKRDRDGNMWVGTRSSGVSRYAVATRKWQDFDVHLLNGSSFWQDKNGQIWIGTTRGVHRMLPDGKHFELVPGTEEGVRDIVELPHNRLLIKAPSRLYTLHKATFRIQEFEPQFPSKKSDLPSFLMTDRQGYVWMTALEELWRFNPFQKTYQVYVTDRADKYSIPPGSSLFPFEDQAGNIWVMTPGQGIYMTNTIRNPFEVCGVIRAENVLPIDEQRLLVVGDREIKIFDTEQKQLNAFELTTVFSKEAIGSVMRLGNELWITLRTSSDFFVYDIQTWQLKQKLSRRGFLNHDRQNRVWIGLEYLDSVSGKWTDIFPELKKAIPAFPDDPYRINHTYFDANNRLWISTNTGTYYYDLQTKKGRAFISRGKGEPATLETFQFFEGLAGRFYLLNSEGFSLYLPNQDEFINFDDNKGLLHNSVGGIVEDARGNAWIGTTTGLQKLDLVTKTFTNYDAEDGMFNPRYYTQTPYRDQQGWLYFGTANRMIRFHPDSLQANQVSAPVYLLDFFLANKLVEPSNSGRILQRQLRFSRKINLTHDQADFGFSFVMPLYYKPDRIEYFYKLKPYEKEWISNGNNNQVQYTNIDPGTYTFRVKAKTAAGVWSTDEASIQVVIAPPWWATWWAYALYGIAFLGIIIGIYRFNLVRQIARSEARQLKELDVLKSRFYTNITHEFRTPLTVIMGVADQIQGHENERQLIRRNSKNLLQLINRLLDLSKIDGGKLQLSYIQADAVSFLRYLTQSFSSLAEEKKIDLEFYADTEELIMDFDEEKLKHIVQNLVSNALKFTPEHGKIQVEVRRTRDDAPYGVGNILRTSTFVLRIMDTGIGIPAEKLQHIFDRFYQVDDSHTRRSEGTGIGLAFAKELVELMQGSISVESEVGKGSVFTVLLPVTHKAPLLEPSIQEEVLPAFKKTDAHAASGTNVDPDQPVLLIIEDNKDVITYIKSLVSRDYQIATANNGQKGIDKALEIIPDIIISDVMMPEKDGFEVVETLKTDERTSHVPIILLTAKATHEDRIIGLQHGADAYLTKPFDKDELFIRLKKLLELRRLLQEKYSGGLSEETNQAPSLDDVFLQKIKVVIEERMNDSELSVHHLCQAVFLSHTQVYRKIKALTGKNPTLYIRSVRLQQAKELLKTTHLSISEVAYQVGFNDPNYFSRAFQQEFGIPPSATK